MSAAAAAALEASPAGVVHAAAAELQRRAQQATARADELETLVSRYKATADALVIELRASKEGSAARIEMRRELRSSAEHASRLPRCRALVEQRTRLLQETRRLGLILVRRTHEFPCACAVQNKFWAADRGIRGFL